ncbi:MAG: cation diffusion facilitator family transporter, partial [Lachnospiraceae bacterium]
MNKNTVGCRVCVKKSENRILLAFLLNLFFAFIEVWGSIVTGSVTIFSDAIHDFGDCIALGMAWRMEKLSKKPPNERYQFGYRRFSVIAGLLNNLILLAGGVIIIVTCIQRFFCPKEINGAGMFVFAVFGILLNGAAMLLTAKGSNINEKTISVHMLEDVLTWVAVLIVGIVMCFFELPVLDSLLSIGMTIVIFCGVAKNLKRIFAVLTVRSPLREAEYRLLKEELAECAPSGTLENLRLFSMDGEDKNA